MLQVQAKSRKSEIHNVFEFQPTNWELDQTDWELDQTETPTTYDSGCAVQGTKFLRSI
jgi:hypothetical protein